VFESALPLSVNLRPAHLGAECGDDRQLREEVERLLASHDQSSRFLGTQAALTMIETIRKPLEGCRVGPYQVIREIGHGGMGSVYLAERADGAFEQRVAIKFISGAATEVLLRRFHDERRILAGFEHANVARLLDGGTTPDGIPYFVMEYVDGVPIHDFCRDHRLTVRARIQLFRQVCAAVQYAHQHLVIHRDIKAGNILVTPDGTPKLLDFGIATTLADPTPGHGSPTITFARAMTPESASPEQVRGEPITVSADIYALGVLFYRLLTGQSPYSSAPSSQAALLRAVCDEIPRPPSTIVAAGDAKRAIGRDLDLITLKALRKEPERRYSTVLQFSDDLQRYVDGRPVLAAPDSAAYRARKFARRHWRILGVAAVAVVAILVGATTALWQARVARRERTIAQQRFEMARQLADSVVFDLNDTLEGVPGSLQARRFVVSKALAYLDQLGQQVGSDVSLMEQVAAAYVRIGDSQGNPYHPNVGDPKGALSSYTRALELYKRTEMKGPSRHVRLAVVTAQEGLGDVHWSVGDFEHASSEYREARSLAGLLAEEEPNRLEFQLKLVSTEYKIGQTRLRVGDLPAAARSFHESVSLAERSLLEHPGNVDVTRGLALGYGKLGDIANEQGDLLRALDRYAKTVALLETIAMRSPHLESHRLVLFHLRVSESLAGLGRWTEAEVKARRALELLQPTIQVAVGDTQASSDQGYAYLTLGDALAGQHRDTAALEAYRTALGAYRTAMVANPRYIENRRELGFCLARIGDLALRARRAKEALVSYLEAMKQLEAREIKPQAANVLAGVYLRAGDAQEKLDPHAPDVLAWYRKSEAVWAERSTRQALTPAQLVLQREAIDKANGRPSTGAGRH
jgi:non-specific serine/threonine protein kinase/serine/threonine-protein kinase